ncbi:Fe-S biogenesis protein NfuA [Enterobacteriaceae endosymbiont of Donacia cincticornis]|uniref:NifU family protein n=1 Tax=Enterobacteriaceae endosymbiont of Donacia cincticornis TaxID=2675773 RepID=UPI0014494B1B|nr:NifU family protein [Enterobacteriaceae endosymbiont of Donacia cincticornis]QJC36101.1 Fe-S biogenesis protein NfuA [Enterobacteriaceae endosymbiont of Donacia cincticornis]
MLQITKSAQKYFLKLLSQKEKNVFIKISVFFKKNIFKGKVTFCDITKIKKDDIKLNFHELKIFVEKNSFIFLKDIKIDIIQHNLSKKINFTILNKNIQNINNIDYLKKNVNIFLENIINPKLLNHGGSIILKNITTNYVVLLEFHGGCKGCIMSKQTLKNWIEKEILDNFPDIKGVHDVTLHKKNKFSYY